MAIDRCDRRRDLRVEDVAGIVHDFNGQLSAIAREAGQFGHRLACGDPVDVPQVVGWIARNAEFLDRMASDLLGRSELGTRHFARRRAPTALRVLIENVIERLVSSRDSARVCLVATEEVTVAVDEPRIQRVVVNLLANALAHAPAASGIVVRLESHASVARISVSHAGRGPSDLERSSAHDEDRQVVEAHGGSMGVERMARDGIRYFVELGRRAST